MVIYLIGLFLFSMVISYAVKKDIVYIIPMSVMATIIILYIFSLLNLMICGVYVVYAIGIIALILFIYMIIRYKRDFIQSISFMPIVIFAFFGILSLWMHNGRQAVLWDELSHWARIVKDMFYLDSLGTHPESMVKFQNYPPGSALLQYLFTKIRGSFVEPELYHGINIIYFALILPLFKNLKSKNIFKTIIFILITIIMPTLFFDKFHISLYVDGLMGIFFAYILLVYFTEKASKFTFINLSLALFVLTIIKPAGIGIAILALFVILMDMCFANRLKIKEYFKSSNIIAAILCIIIPAVAVLAAKLSWDVYLSTSNASIAFDTSKITFHKIIDVLIKFNGTEAQKDIMLNFLKAVVSFDSNQTYINFILNVPPITYIVLFICAGTIMHFKSDDSLTKKRVLVAGISLFIACAVYLFIQLSSYLFLFTEYEGVHLASFTRYFGTFLLGVYALIIGYMLIKSDDNDNKKRIPKYIVIFLIMIAITGLYSFISVTVLAPFGTRSTIETRREYEQISSIKNEVDSGETIYFIDIGSNGYSYHLCGYIAYPIKLNSLGSIGTSRYYEGDIWTRIVTPDELKEDLLNNFNYLYIQNTEYNFEQEYGHLFGGVDNISQFTLYYVDKSEKDFILKKVD